MRRAGEPGGEIDVTRVIRRARARRLPRLLAVGGAACLALGAVIVPTSLLLGDRPGGEATTLSDQAGGAEAPESAREDGADSELDAGSTMASSVTAASLQL